MALHRIEARHLILLVALAGLVNAARPLNAGFSAELVDIVADGQTFRWNYQLIFQTLPGRERLEAGNGVVAPGVIGSPDFLTIYDFDAAFPLSSNLVVQAGPGFVAQTQSVGVDPAFIIPLDGQAATNITFRYVGPPISTTTEMVFGGFSILFPAHPLIPGTTRAAGYGSQRTDNFGLTANRKITELGSVLVPFVIVPEPSTWLLLMFACLAMLTMRRFSCRVGPA
jgi:hypothetical protein